MLTTDLKFLGSLKGRPSLVKPQARSVLTQAKVTRSFTELHKNNLERGGRWEIAREPVDILLMLPFSS